VDGKLYDVVWGRYTVTMMYNKRLLAKVGLKPPTTWDEWKAQCAKIKKTGMTPISMAGDGSIDAFWFTELATAALGSKGYDALASGKKKFTDTELQQTMQFVLDMVPYYQSGFLATKYVDSKALFATEKVVYFEAGTADVPGFRTINPNLDIGIFAFPPVSKTEGQYSTLSGLSVTVGGNPKSSNPDAIYKFQNWCLSAKGATLCCQAINITPVVKGLVLPGDPVLQQMIKVSQNDHHVWYEIPRLAPGFNIWATEGQGVFTGRLNSTQLLQLMQKQADAAAKSS
jgi:raffinose/stachyose/melibiose transport system substrate-binding protein